MLHKVKLTVIDKKLYPQLQEQYCADKNAGMCPCYHVGDEFIFERYGTSDDFWHMGLNTLKQTAHTGSGMIAGAAFPHCSEAWDAISRYIYTGLQGGSIMRGWMKDERVMIACCSDGTRPVIFKIERMDYKVIDIDGIHSENDKDQIKSTLGAIAGVKQVVFCETYIEVYLHQNVEDTTLECAVQECGAYRVLKIDGDQK